jgi:hypothetical protein
MPHYFLHIQDGADLIEGPDGAEYDDVAAYTSRTGLISSRTRTGPNMMMWLPPSEWRPKAHAT